MPWLNICRPSSASGAPAIEVPKTMARATMDQEGPDGDQRAGLDGGQAGATEGVRIACPENCPHRQQDEAAPGQGRTGKAADKQDADARDNRGQPEHAV